MILVLFEVTVKKEGAEEYRALAASLKDELARVKGYVRSERFVSLAHEGKLLSLSAWESEEAVDAWRNVLNHRICQRQSREALFENYTITVATQLRSYTDADRGEAPEDSRVAHPGGGKRAYEAGG